MNVALAEPREADVTELNDIAVLRLVLLATLTGTFAGKVDPGRVHLCLLRVDVILVLPFSAYTGTMVQQAKIHVWNERGRPRR